VAARPERPASFHRHEYKIRVAKGMQTNFHLPCVYEILLNSARFRCS
jgi:S-adenosylmethionine:tRNA-ribosyltransferase-isomerase (queuine synthetase)